MRSCDTEICDTYKYKIISKSLSISSFEYRQFQIQLKYMKTQVFVLKTLFPLTSCWLLFYFRIHGKFPESKNDRFHKYYFKGTS